ncbi:hypothetical protein ACEQ8H_007562 [Pleosporales sp. CAS-2024a]
MSSIGSRVRNWNLDIDCYLNRAIPPSPLYRFPAPISRLLGYRRTQRQDVGNVAGAFWSMLGAFCGLAAIAGVFNNTESVQQRHPAALIASFGASTILEYNAIRSPFSQPRNALLGHTLSALIGVGIAKLFQYHSDYDSIKWTAGALACGIASAVMLLTNTVHPPGGATAVLAAMEPAITAMGWYFVGLVLWGATLMLGVGLVINNIQRQFPMYWWTPLDLRPGSEEAETVPNGRGGIDAAQEQESCQEDMRIQITGVSVLMPGNLSLSAEEAQVLAGLGERLRERVNGKPGGCAEDGMEKAKWRSGRSSAEMTVVPSRSRVRRWWPGNVGSSLATLTT